MLAGALMARCDVAKAGHWEIESVVADGKTTYPAAGDYGPNDGGPVEGSVQDRWQGFPNSADTGQVSKGSSYQDASTTKPGVTMQMKDVGSAKVIFVWVPKNSGYPDGSEPPAWVFAKVTIEASAYAGSFWKSTGTEEYSGRPAVPADGSNPEDSVSVSAFNGFETATDLGLPDTISDDGQWRRRGRSITTTKVLVQASGRRDHVTMELPGASAIATATGGPRWGQATVGSYAGYSIELTDRAVWISSDIEPSYYKSASPPPDAAPQPVPAPVPGTNPPAWRVPVKRTATGMTVHSAATFAPLGSLLNGISQSAGWHGLARYTVNSAGYTQPEYSWTLPSSMKGQYLDNKQSVFAGGIGSTEEADGSTSYSYYSDYLGGDKLGLGKNGTTVKVRVSERQANGAPALEDEYSVVWHHPYENWGLYAPSWKKWQAYAPVSGTASPAEAERNGSITAQFLWDNYTYSDHLLAEGMETGFEVAANMMTNPLWATFFAAAGMASEELFSASDQQKSVVFNDAWKDACTNPALGSTFLDTAPPDGSGENATQMSYYRMVNPKRMVQYEYRPLKADTYDSHGYSGLLRRVSKTPTGAVTMAADFEYRGNS